MAIYAISDLHLSFGTNKPMHVFGDKWKDHPLIVKENWLKIVGEDDYVLIPGDISWGINLEEADPDLAFIESLPGKKIMSKGNHDYWWCTNSKFRKHFEERGYKTLSILHNNAYKIGDYVVCGTRGWKTPNDDDFSQEDRKILNRELERLKLSLKEGQKLGGEIIVMLHFPPIDKDHMPNEFGRLLKEYDVKTCIYGHIHGKDNEKWESEFIDGIWYHIVTCNLINFIPLKVK
ncbi:MAG: serine/threonine protein phosphatase [Clostridiaceae bacterium]|nr:serine/threonine protein phosphatase [Clostridiaceae bacterium]